MIFSLAVLLASSLLVENATAFSPTSSVVIKKNVGGIPLREASPEASSEGKQPKLKAIILDPFLPAADPTYLNKGAVGEDEFIVSRTGGPTEDELTDENLYRIIKRNASDLDVNTLVWKCLGYRFNASEESWSPDDVFPKWKDRFPTPPDFIGMQRIYSKDIDGPNLRNNQALVKSIPAENKASYLKKHMLPFGFTGYKVCTMRWAIVYFLPLNPLTNPPSFVLSF
jgi:hypothetical protein